MINDENLHITNDEATIVSYLNPYLCNVFSVETKEKFHNLKEEQNKILNEIKINL